MKPYTRFAPDVVGSKNGRSKLTEADILKIRELGKTNRSLQQIGNRFGVKSTTIFRVINHQSWKHV